MAKSVFSDAYASFLRVLIALRRRQGVSQAELAKRIGREQPIVSLIERGIRRVDLIEFCALMRALNVPPEEAFAEVVEALPKKLDAF
jgi:transcriptional regulator with XRE-family HTH domain